MAKDILDAVYGCLIAGAVGDALGAPSENMYPHEIQAQFGRIEDLLAYDKTAYSAGTPGAATDDTTLKHYMCLAIVAKGGRITPDDAARVWLEDLNPDRFWNPDRVTYLKLQAGMNPWDVGRDNIPSACATMGMAPIGIINAGNPAQAYQDGYNVAALNGDHFNQAAAATYATGVAAALAPDATLDGVLQTMTAHGSSLVQRAIERMFDAADETGDVPAFRDCFYEYLIDWWSRPARRWDKEHYVQGTGIESVPLAMTLLYLCRDVNEVMIEAANFGRDADSIANMAGSIAGAIQGASAVRQDWIDTVEEANIPFFEEVEGDPEANFYRMAERMVAALHAERENVRARLATLDRILGKGE